MGLDRRDLLAAGAALGLGQAALAAGSRPVAAEAPPGPHDIVLAPGSLGDHTRLLEQALATAAGRRAALVLAPGDYRIAPLTLPRHTRLVGPPEARLVFTGRQAGLIARDADTVDIQGLTLTGGSEPLAAAQGARGLLTVDGCRRLRLERVTLLASAGHGLAVTRAAGSVGRCTISGAADAGLFALDSDGLTIEGCRVADCANNGILVWRSAPGPDRTQVHDNRIARIGAAKGGTGQNGNGINVFRAHAVSVRGNRIEDCAFSGVRANAASSVVIQSNSIAGAGEVALYVEFAFEGAVVSGNTVEDAADGISITNFNEGGRLAVVEGNLVRNLTRRAPTEGPHGLGIAVEADTAVTGNVIENAPTAGLFIGFGAYQRDVVATGNLIRRSPIGIAVQGDRNAGKVLLTGNLISGASAGAIRAMDRWRPSGSDLAAPAARLPAHIALGQNLVT